MVLVKDKLNLFMKDQEVTDEELYERFGIDAAMLENLMYKEKTEDGTVIRWGNQKSPKMQKAELSSAFCCLQKCFKLFLGHRQSFGCFAGG